MDMVLATMAPTVATEVPNTGTTALITSAVEARNKVPSLAAVVQDAVVTAIPRSRVTSAPLVEAAEWAPVVAEEESSRAAADVAALVRRSTAITNAATTVAQSKGGPCCAACIRRCSYETPKKAQKTNNRTVCPLCGREEKN